MSHPSCPLRSAGPPILGSRLLQLNQVPEVAVEVLEDGDGPVGSLLWVADERDPGRAHPVEVPPEIVRAKEEEDAAARLTADEAFLLRTRGACQEDRRTRRSWRRNQDPAFVLLGLITVFYEVEMELAAEERDGFVVVPDDQGRMKDGLEHPMPSSRRASVGRG